MKVCTADQSGPKDIGNRQSGCHVQRYPKRFRTWFDMFDIQETFDGIQYCLRARVSDLC